MTKRIAIPVVAVVVALPLAVWAARGPSQGMGQRDAGSNQRAEQQQSGALQPVAMDGGTPEWPRQGTGGSGQHAGTMGGKAGEMIDAGMKEMQDAGVKLPHMRDGGTGGSGANEPNDLE